jgi:ABC-type multidrug transport system ATPase subunit
MISVRELRKAYGSLVAVDGVSLEIAPHETLALLGPNGAGKTTTIHMLVGLIRPDSGEISINNAGSPDNPSVRRHIGIAPQALATYGDLTADENLRFFGRIYSLHGRKLRRRVDAALDMAGLESRRRDLVKTFSGGMQRRLHLACAILHEPQVLFLDEPTIGVDPQARNHILEAIEQLRREGCTIILTTHYMEEAERLSDRVAVMDQGLSKKTILAMDCTRWRASIRDNKAPPTTSEGECVAGGCVRDPSRSRGRPDPGVVVPNTNSDRTATCLPGPTRQTAILQLLRPSSTDSPRSIETHCTNTPAPAPARGMISRAI